ncbi:glycosyltransferase family 2 protein [Trabulsiella odontotermitis]|uniref:Glycosyl transferase family 2 n=1 Tax=Trabulsiella odontotermitis TaxID=379893 RepID=A0A0L0GZB7_9ENTR|nr:glycosyltransferase family 2 protein [Trabulsiella odontotermitis]KNC94550.1 glycosyl transferase family 2 [Trabulsiella odontotermitis]
MKVSIITATYNSLPFIRETYSSVLSQTYTDWEWCVTDDCSKDGTYEYLLHLSLVDKRIIVQRNKTNEGAAVARNLSLSASTGDYIAFIDSDDLWTPDKIEKQLNFMLQNKLDFTFTAYEIIDESSISINKYVDINQNNPLSYEDMLKKKATLGCSTVMLRKLAIADLTMPLLRTGQDYALWLKILKEGTKAFPYNQILMKYRIVSTSISRNKLRKAMRQWQIYREIEKLPLYKSCYCFLFYAWRAIFRK